MDEESLLHLLRDLIDSAHEQHGIPRYRVERILRQILDDFDQD